MSNGDTIRKLGENKTLHVPDKRITAMLPLQAQRECIRLQAMTSFISSQ